MYTSNLPTYKPWRVRSELGQSSMNFSAGQINEKCNCLS